VPTIKELYSLWNVSVGWPYINSDYFTITYSTEEDLSHAIFWSSDKYTGVLGNISGAPGAEPGAELAFGVNFGTGHIKAYNIAEGPMHFVRCVRGNLAYGGNLFQNNNDGTISDLATGLIWQQTDNGSGIDWKHALAYAQTQNNANYLGHNDWRLPNAKELQSIVDYTRSPYATDSANVGPAINALFSCTGILNDGGKADYPYYWTSTSAISQQNGIYASAWYVAFGMAEDGNGEDLHGAGAVRFDKKILGTGTGEERVLNYVRLVRNESSTGINETKDTHLFNVYPNPISDELTIEMRGGREKVNFELVNSIGQTVQNGSFIEKTVIQANNLATGVYLIKLQHGNTFEVTKLIKE
jgi:hypothetical protein